MSSFEKRGEGFEKKFALDSELQFKAEARRNRLLGLWAADKLFKQVRADFDKAGVTASDHQIRRSMDEFLAEAIQQIKQGN